MDIVAYPDGHNEAVTTDDSYLRPGNQPALILRRSGRIGRFTQAYRSVLESGASDEIEEDPLSYREALSQTRSASWKVAMGAEFRSLLKNRIWTYCSMVPDGAHLISCKWVYILKTNPDGSCRFKARLVIRGFEQTEFGETFAPVAKLVSLRMIIALSSLRGWEIDHMDVVTAFLNPPVYDNIYMCLPEGIESLDPTKPTTATVCKLNKALYGLKEAPRLWYNHIDEFLLSIGFRKSENDPNLYQLIDGELVLLLYIDDLLIAAKSRRRIYQVKQLLHNRYKMNDLGSARQFLGLEIDQLPDGRFLLNQARFVMKVLRCSCMENCNGVCTPMETGQKLLPAEETDEMVEPREYQSLVGSLMSLAIGTRPDITFAISTLSKLNARPETKHLLPVKRVLRYLRQTTTLSLIYHRTQNSALVGFTDSDFAGDLDDRKSTSGYVFTLASGAVSWKSKKQSLVSLSSTEAEYVGCSEAAREAIWLRRLYHEITKDQLKSTIPAIQLLLSDSQGAISLAQAPRVSDRTKHIDIKYYFVRDTCANGLVRLGFISTAEMTPDVMTKALPHDAHQKHIRGMGLTELS